MNSDKHQVVIASREAGYTLVETIVVMLIVGTLSVVSIGQISSFRQHMESIPGGSLIGHDVDGGELGNLDLSNTDLGNLGLGGVGLGSMSQGG